MVRLAGLAGLAILAVIVTVVIITDFYLHADLRVDIDPVLGVVVDRGKINVHDIAVTTNHIFELFILLFHIFLVMIPFSRVWFTRVWFTRVWFTRMWFTRWFARWFTRVFAWFSRMGFFARFLSAVHVGHIT